MEVSQETKLELPWNLKVKVKVAQSCPTLCDPMDYTVQYSWASLVAQLVKNPPAMWESYHMNQQLHSSVISEKKNENTNLKRYMQPNVHNSIVCNCQGYGSNLSVHQQMNGQRQCSVYTLYLAHRHMHRKTHNGILFSHENRMKFCHLQQHGWTWMVLCLVK